MDMIWELMIGTVLLTLLIVVMTPAMWSSRLSLREKQKKPEGQGPKD
ncbi:MULTISPECIES: hypothetical protein [Myxococcus]|nr:MULTISPECIES: hypothetical protein [Myxococcus]MCK8499957.1 hypothetical protein [Myxococcus fulvus]